MSSLPPTIVMASSNAGKLRELSRLLENLGVEVVAQSEFGVTDAHETADTFAGNSLIKARHAALVTGLPAIADDSGLAVDALGGSPGVRSARYAGEGASDRDNLDKLLDAMRDVPDDARGAAFHCVATFVSPAGGEPLVAEGIWRGSILRAPRGDGGFGYDPVFLDPESGLTGAELAPELKNARSHRGQALRHLVQLLDQRYP